MPGRGLFVTGTDTGVGKTLVACALAAWACARGLDVGVMKPIATGGRRRGRRWVSDDAQRLAACASARDPWPLINPICFREPLAPWTAARRMGAALRLAPAVDAFRALAARHDAVIVEGIGGLLVPLNARQRVADLAEQMALPILLVTRPDLGTLNHTLLSLAELRRRGLHCIGVVVNHARPRPRDRWARLAQQTNPEVLARFGRVLGVLPYWPGAAAEPPRRRALAEWVERHLDTAALWRALTGR